MLDREDLRNLRINYASTSVSDSGSYSDPCYTSKMKDFAKVIVSYFRKTFQVTFRCLTGFWIHLWKALWYCKITWKKILTLYKTCLPLKSFSLKFLLTYFLFTLYFELTNLQIIKLKIKIKKCKKYSYA